MNATPSTYAKHKADLQRSLHLCTREGLVAMPVVTMSLPVNVFITALVTKAYHLTTPQIGLMSAMPFFANFIQIFAAPFFSKWRPPKTVTVLAATGHMITWALLAVLLSYIPQGDPDRAAHWLIGWFFVSSCFSAVAGVTWNAWIQEWVPLRVRGKFFGRRNRYLQFSTLAFLLITGWIVAHWQYAVPAFQGVIVGAVFLRVFSLYWQWTSPTRPHRPVPPPTLSIREQLRIINAAGSFKLFIAFGALWYFATNCFGPFYHVFMFEEIGFSAWDVGVVSTLAQLGGALSLPAWGLLLDRYGNKSVMTFSLLLWQALNFMWCFFTPQNRDLLYLNWTLGGATSAGFVLGQFTILLRLIPLEAKSLAIGLNLAITSIVAATAPILGGWILSWAFAHWSDRLAIYHVVFLLQPILCVFGAALLLRVQEPQASSITMVFGAMRNLRTLGGVLGLDFLVNYVFYRPQKK